MMQVDGVTSLAVNTQSVSPLLSSLLLSPSASNYRENSEESPFLLMTDVSMHALPTRFSLSLALFIMIMMHPVYIYLILAMNLEV